MLQIRITNGNGKSSVENLSVTEWKPLMIVQVHALIKRDYYYAFAARDANHNHDPEA